MGQQVGGVQAQLTGDVEIIGEGGGSGKEGHNAVPMATAHLLVVNRFLSFCLHHGKAY
ncbi:hypothetical protein D3C85_1855800 [compost metagenome]